jgi:splicing factor 3B subunit 5
MAGGVDRFNVNASLSSNWEFLQTRFAGTGHPDITRHEWAAQHHRDTLASMLGHADLLSYAAAAEGVAVGRMRHTLLEKMLQPVGPRPRVVVPVASAAAGAGSGAGAGAGNGAGAGAGR